MEMPNSDERSLRHLKDQINWTQLTTSMLLSKEDLTELQGDPQYQDKIEEVILSIYDFCTVEKFEDGSNVNMSLCTAVAATVYMYMLDVISRHIEGKVKESYVEVNGKDLFESVIDTTKEMN